MTDFSIYLSTNYEKNKGKSCIIIVSMTSLGICIAFAVVVNQSFIASLVKGGKSCKNK